MANSFKLEKYDFDDFDKYFALRPPVLLIAVIVFLCRDLVISALVAATSSSGDSGNGVAELFAIDNDWIRFVAAAPAIVVMCALFSRVPSAAKPFRLAWRRGRMLLTLAVFAQIAVLLRTEDFFVDGMRHGSIATAIVLAQLAGILAYLALSKRAHDAFLSFPKLDPAPAGNRPTAAN